MFEAVLQVLFGVVRLFSGTAQQPLEHLLNLSLPLAREIGETFGTGAQVFDDALFSIGDAGFYRAQVCEVGAEQFVFGFVFVFDQRMEVFFHSLLRLVDGDVAGIFDLLCSRQAMAQQIGVHIVGFRIMLVGGIFGDVSQSVPGRNFQVIDRLGKLLCQKHQSFDQIFDALFVLMNFRCHSFLDAFQSAIEVSAQLFFQLRRFVFQQLACRRLILSVCRQVTFGSLFNGTLLVGLEFFEALFTSVEYILKALTRNVHCHLANPPRTTT